MKTAVVVSISAILAASTIANADIFGDENRGLLSQKMQELKLNDQDVALIRRASGYIECKYSDDPNGKQVISAALIGSTKFITTVIHVFKKRLDLDSCVFQNFHGSRPTPLNFTSEDKSIISNYTKNYAISLDQIKIQLQRRVGKVAYEFDDSGTVPEDGTPVIGVTADEDDFVNPDLNDPIVRGCSVMAPYGNDMAYKVDCDMSHGASGGVNLFRNASQKLVVRGLFKQVHNTYQGKPSDPFDLESHYGASAVLNPANYQ
jgi:hypothetical protein